jgi:hypothetical protein
VFFHFYRTSGDGVRFLACQEICSSISEAECRGQTIHPAVLILSTIAEMSDCPLRAGSEIGLGPKQRDASIDRGRDGSSPPLPPNRAGGSPAHGSPVGGLTS